MYSLFYSASLWVTLFFSGVFAGAGGELVLQTLEKAADVRSYEQVSVTTFEVSYSGADEDGSIRRMKNVIEAFEYTVHTVFDGSLKDGRYDMRKDITVSMDPIQFRGDIWMSVDAGGNNFDYDITVKIPALIRAFLPDDFAKDYMHINYAELLTLAEDSHEFYYAMNLMQLFGSYHMQGYLFEMTAPMNLPRHLADNITLRITEAQDGMVLAVSMSDAQLKGFVMAILNELHTNTDAVDALTDMLAMLGQDDMTDVREDIMEWAGEVIPELAEFFANNAILSGRGYTYEATLNQDGHVVSETIVIGISLGGDMLFPFAYGYYDDDYPYDDFEDMDAPVVEFTMTVTNEYTNINGEVEINIPARNADNSFNLADVIRKNMEEQQEAQKFRFPFGWYSHEKLAELDEEPVDFSLTGTYRGAGIDTEISLIRYNFSYYMPVRQAMELFGGELLWDDEQRVAVWTFNSRDIALFSDKDEHLSLYEKYLDAGYWLEPGVVVNDRMFISVSNVQSFTRADFGFDNELGVLLVRDR
jgi:hypothetical protein